MSAHFAPPLEFNHENAEPPPIGLDFVFGAEPDTLDDEDCTGVSPFTSDPIGLVS